MNPPRRERRARTLGVVRVAGARFLYLSEDVEGLDEDVGASLAPAEREVARLAADGLSNEEIARARGTAARTIANQLASIYRKLGVGSRVELIALLARNAK